jgi:hypothetical protein
MGKIQKIQKKTRILFKQDIKQLKLVIYFPEMYSTIQLKY